MTFIFKYLFDDFFNKYHSNTEHFIKTHKKYFLSKTCPIYVLILLFIFLIFIFLNKIYFNNNTFIIIYLLIYSYLYM